MPRSRPAAIGLAALATFTGLLGACGSSTSSGSAQTAAVRASCQQVSAVLSDGPDPDADPVGYAEAQVLPLRRDVQTTDKSLQTAVEDLASAYESFYSTNGSASANTAVNQAVKKVDAICPGAA